MRENQCKLYENMKINKTRKYMRLILRHRLNLVKTSLVALKIVFKTKDFLRNIDVPEQNKMNMSYYKIFMEQFHHFRHVK